MFATNPSVASYVQANRLVPHLGRRQSTTMPYHRYMQGADPGDEHCSELNEILFDLLDARFPKQLLAQVLASLDPPVHFYSITQASGEPRTDWPCLEEHLFNMVEDKCCELTGRPQPLRELRRLCDQLNIAAEPFGSRPLRHQRFAA